MCAGGRGNALEAVMGVWIERQLEFVGRYRINLATTALVQLLASRHPALMALQVPLLPQICSSMKRCLAVPSRHHRCIC